VPHSVIRTNDDLMSVNAENMAMHSYCAHTGLNTTATASSPSTWSGTTAAAPAQPLVGGRLLIDHRASRRFWQGRLGLLPADPCLQSLLLGSAAASDHLLGTKQSTAGTA